MKLLLSFNNPGLVLLTKNLICGCFFLSLGHSRYRQKQYDAALRAYDLAAKAGDAAVAPGGTALTCPP